MPWFIGNVPIVTTAVPFCLSSEFFPNLGRKYKSAAKQFLDANLDYCDCPDLMSPHNVAIYGGLTALATFDRTELFKLVISSSQFKVGFLNLPHVYMYNVGKVGMFFEPTASPCI